MLCPLLPCNSLALRHLRAICVLRDLHCFSGRVEHCRQSHLPRFARPSSPCISSRQARKRFASNLAGAVRRRKRINSLVFASVSVSAKSPPRSRLIAAVSFAKRVMLILSAVAGASGWSFFAAFIFCNFHTKRARRCQSADSLVRRGHPTPARTPLFSWQSGHVSDGSPGREHDQFFSFRLSAALADCGESAQLWRQREARLRGAVAAVGLE